MRIVNYTVLLILLFFSQNLFAQNDSVVYSSEFEFVDGIYRTFDEFRNNNPSILKEAIVTTNLLGLSSIVGSSSEKLQYIDSEGILKTLKRKEIWGYCSDGKVYVLCKRRFIKMFKIGAICYFTETNTNWHFDANSVGYTTTKKYDYLMDMNTGEIVSYEPENFSIFLAQDQELYNEFTSIKSYRKKKKQLFLYLLRFNEKHPIYFQTNYSALN